MRIIVCIFRLGDGEVEKCRKQETFHDDVICVTINKSCNVL